MTHVSQILLLRHCNSIQKLEVLLGFGVKSDNLECSWLFLLSALVVLLNCFEHHPIIPQNRLRFCALDFRFNL